MRRNRERGFSMIEVLVTIAILVFGLMGMVGLQVRSTAMEVESYQRAQALILLQDMADRLSANKAGAPCYVVSNVGAATYTISCALTGAARTQAEADLGEWSNALLGASEKSGTRNVGAMIGARGCIVSPSTNLYIVTVAWQGLSPTVAPVEPCGAAAYGDDRQRRTTSMVVRVATLSAT